MEGQQNPTANAGGDPVSAIADAAGKLFNFLSIAIQGDLLATRAYFEQLLRAAPKLQNPFADVNANRRTVNLILIFGGLGIIALLIVAVIIKQKRNAST